MSVMSWVTWRQRKYPPLGPGTGKQRMCMSLPRKLMQKEATSRRPQWPPGPRCEPPCRSVLPEVVPGTRTNPMSPRHRLETTVAHEVNWRLSVESRVREG